MKGGPGKLRSYWEQKVYSVIQRKCERPVHVIELEWGGESRTVHRNLLFHSSENLPDETDNDHKQQEQVDMSGPPYILRDIENCI